MNKQGNDSFLKNASETNRLESFSDGVFGVAITLLALEIVIPPNKSMTDGGLIKEILALWPKYFAYLNSFVTVLLMWIAHHTLFKMIKYVSVPLFIANGFLMFLAVLTPFPTRILGDYINTSAFRTAAVFYTAFFVLVSIAFTVLWFVVKGKKALLHAHITEQEIKKQTQIEFIGLSCNIGITVLTFFNPWVGLILNTGMWIYWLVNIK